MAPEKNTSAARTVETDPNYMLMFYMLNSIPDVGKQVDWEAIRDKIKLPTVSATQKRWSRLHVAQSEANAAAGDDEPSANPVTKRGPRKRKDDDEEEGDKPNKKTKTANAGAAKEKMGKATAASTKA